MLHYTEHFLMNGVFYEFFNKNRIKISYGTMLDMEIIKGHNQKVSRVKSVGKNTLL